MHYSLVLHRERKLAAWVAWNIDGGHIKKVNRVDFKKDPHLPMEAQIGNELYKHNDLDRGHMARRAELCWGTLAEQKKPMTILFIIRISLLNINVLINLICMVCGDNLRMRFLIRPK